MCLECCPKCGKKINIVDIIIKCNDGGYDLDTVGLKYYCKQCEYETIQLLENN